MRKIPQCYDSTHPSKHTVNSEAKTRQKSQTKITMSKQTSQSKDNSEFWKLKFSPNGGNPNPHRLTEGLISNFISKIKYGEYKHDKYRSYTDNSKYNTEW